VRRGDSSAPQRMAPPELRPPLPPLSGSKLKPSRISPFHSSAVATPASTSPNSPGISAIVYEPGWRHEIELVRVAHPDPAF
jgi:hypothetical protein